MVTTLQRYENLVQIGTGSMGTVYRARDKVLDRDVALKMMRTGAGVDPDIRERFYREARACARLKHPNIVAVYDLGQDGDVAYIAMELLHGADLRKVIEQRRKLSFPVQLQAMIDVCEALDHAHRHGVIHRDIKPSNLMLQDDNRIKVMDFGIARLSSSRLTMAGKILGTPNYMAPEQILGKACDGRADLFSAAIVFFELLTWAHPFQAEVILKRIVEGEPDSIFDHSVTVPVPMEKIISRALSKEPENRYLTAAEMAADLRALLDAVRQNASPTMARMELPSERMLPRDEVNIEADATQIRPAPSGEDPAEWRLSEVLRLIPAFEEALDKGDRDLAVQRLDELRGIASADRRFVSAVTSCEDSFLKKWPAERSATAAAAMASATLSGATLIMEGIGTPQPAPPPVASNGSKVASDRGSSQPGQMTHSVPKSPRLFPAWPETARLPGLTASQTALLAGTATAVLILLIASFVVRRAFPVERLQPSVGTAAVQSAARVKAAASDTSETLITVPRGASVNLLDVPTTANAEWIRVQYVPNGKPQKQGYMRSADLSAWQEWTITEPSKALRLAQLMMPEDSDTDQRIRAYVGAARRFKDQLPGPAADDLNLEITRLEKILEARNPTPPQPEPPKPVDGQPNPAANPTGQPGQPPTPGATEPKDPKEVAAQNVRAGWNYISRGEYGKARQSANRALQLDPGSADARKLLKEVEEWEK